MKESRHYTLLIYAEGYGSGQSEKINKILLNINLKSVTIILTKFLKSFKIDGGLKNE